MTASSVYRVAALGLAAVLTIQATNASACTRRPEVKYDPRYFPYHPPGSYGELDRTVTLDCLSYVGSIQRNGREHVLIQDERGKVHVLTVGDWMGWSRSMIIKIDADYIYLRQLPNMIEAPYTGGRDLRNATQEEINKYYEHIGKEVTVRFPKRAKQR